MPAFDPVERHLLQLDDAEKVNAAIWKQYQAVRNDPAVRKSHFFEGRYENIYIDALLVSSLGPVLTAAREGARRMLGDPAQELAVGFWFNEMHPGDVTVPHDHDEGDELLSAVYYVRVPCDSGQLLLGRGEQTVTLTPVEGRLVFFRPGVVHEVTRNLSSGVRLSIGMNFGPASHQVQRPESQEGREPDYICDGGE